MNDPKSTVLHLFEQKYQHAQAMIWAGSTSTGNYTSNSDLDVVIVFSEVPHAYREAFIFEDWRVDAFIHDLGTLKYFFEEIDRPSGMPVLPEMVANGVLISAPNALSKKIKSQATELIQRGPPVWSKLQIDKARFFITDLLDDILSPRNRVEQQASAAKLYEPLAEFYFRSQNKWQASGKAILHYLKKENYELATDWQEAFDEIFKHGDTRLLEKLVNKILTPFGGLFWDGFHLDAPQNWRK